MTVSATELGALNGTPHVAVGRFVVDGFLGG